MACREVLLVLSLCIIATHGALRFANYYQDNMVLQRAPQRSVVWGYGDTNAKTTLFTNNKFYHTISGAKPVNRLGESIWSVTLDAESAEGPFEVLVTQPVANGSLVTISLKNVLYGDVWVCSGQSNMQMAIIDSFNASTEIANAGNYPKIRLFTAQLIASPTPVEELLGITQGWSVASASSVGGPSYQYISAVCWYYGRMVHVALNGRPIGLIATSWGGTAIELWMPPPALRECGIDSKEKTTIEPYGQPNFEGLTVGPSELYNSMIYPFTRMVVTGALWYQGESNAYQNREIYACLFEKMIRYWRTVWNTRTGGITDANFPFGFVQLSTNERTGNVVGGFPWIRWYQTFGVGYVPNDIVPNVFMAAAMDLRDDDGNIHPRTKEDVGYRLSRAGLAVHYKQNVEFQGPIVATIVVSSGNTSIDITYASVTGIQVRNTAGFEVCCQGLSCTNDNLWLAAPAALKGGLTITLTIPSACVSQKIYGVRYLWRETPCPFKQAAVYSSTDTNLPAPPYIKVF